MASAIADVRRLLREIAGARRMVVTSARVTKQVREKRAEGKRTKRVSTDRFVFSLFAGGQLHGLSESEATQVRAALAQALHEGLAPLRSEMLRRATRSLDARLDLIATKHVEEAYLQVEQLDNLGFYVTQDANGFSVSCSGEQVTLVGSDEEERALVTAVNTRLGEIVEPYAARLEEQARALARSLSEHA